MHAAMQLNQCQGLQTSGGDLVRTTRRQPFSRLVSVR